MRPLPHISCSCRLSVYMLSVEHSRGLQCQISSPFGKEISALFCYFVVFFSCLPSYDRQQIEWSVPDWSNFNEQDNQQTRAIQLQSIRCLQNVRIQSRGFDTNERQLKCMHQHCTPRTQFRWDERKNSNNNKMDMMKYWSTIIQSEMAMREW